ncbi:MAG TPA: BatA domain-containing protein [Draconibacterium sp.]|nr:BatA domain-containing protein [Draconibacterium sp.]
MKFLFPTFLFALFTIAIPILIHLFSFRRYKTVYFSDVGFLQNIKKESKKKSRLKQILILLARILTIAFLVIAFSQPYVPLNKEIQKKPNQIVGIYIDNSFSMNALSEQGQLLEVARNKAAEIGLAYPAGTKFMLITNDLEPKHQHLFNREQFIQQVSEVESSPKVIPLSMIYNRFASENTDVGKNTDRILYLISDFQRSITDLENFKDQSIFNYFLPLVPNQVANLYIDSCWVEVPAHRLNQEESIFVRIKNSSDQDYQNLPLTLYMNDSVKSITNFSVEAQNGITANLKYKNSSGGSQLGKIEITDYPFTHDNTWYISYFVEPKLKALAIYSNNQESKEGLDFVSALFKNDDYIQLDEMDMQSLQISKLAEYNTIFLVNPENFSSGFLNELEKAVAGGGSVALFPGSLNNPMINNTFLSKFGANHVIGIDTTQQEISGIEFDNRFYQNVFKKREENAALPKIAGHLKFTENTRTSETRLLWFQNGDNAFSWLPYKKGKVWIFAFPLDKKNEAFAHDILFVPTLYNIVLNSLPSQQISYTIGKNTFFDVPKNENIDMNKSVEIVNLMTGEKFIPEESITESGTRIEFGSQINKAGHYLLQNGDLTLAVLAFNYDRKESDLRYFSADELKNNIQNAQLKKSMVIENVENNFVDVFKKIQNGRQLWKWCVLLALFFILAEVAISRFMR